MHKYIIADFSRNSKDLNAEILFEFLQGLKKFFPFEGGRPNTSLRREDGSPLTFHYYPNSMESLEEAEKFIDFVGSSCPESYNVRLLKMDGLTREIEGSFSGFYFHCAEFSGNFVMNKVDL